MLIDVVEGTVSCIYTTTTTKLRHVALACMAPKLLHRTSLEKCFRRINTACRNCGSKN